MTASAREPVVATVNTARYLYLAAFIALCDQASKVAAVMFLTPDAPLNVAPSVDLVLVYNTGAAFSLLASAGGWQRWFLLALSLAICVFLLAWLRRLPATDKRAAAGIALILGGAFGNIIDRAYLGYVVDFIDISYANYHWPAFNIADSAITVGAVALVFGGMWGK